MLFTRLPLWRVVRVEKRHYSSALLYWPVVGFLTGLTMWGVLRAAAFCVPMPIACLFAIVARLLLTGALHEDGFADFCDGFGGGRDKESILRIMKDSHIGGYGVMGLCLYFVLYMTLLFDLRLSPGIVLGADVGSKLCTTLMINSLAYVRKEEESKVKVLYRHIRFYEFLPVAVPALGVLWYIGAPLVALVPVLITVFLFGGYLKRKIGGYTGDCCGAAVLIAETVFYLTVLVLQRHYFL